MTAGDRQQEIFDELEDLDAERLRLLDAGTGGRRAADQTPEGLGLRLDELRSVTGRMSDLIQELRSLLAAGT
jgi:hypothetical protein